MPKIKSTYILLATAILLLIVLFTVITLSFLTKNPPATSTPSTPTITPIRLRISPIIEGTEKVKITPNPTSMLKTGKEEKITISFTESINPDEITIVFNKRSSTDHQKNTVKFNSSYDNTTKTLALQMNEKVESNTEYAIQVLGPINPKIKARANRQVLIAITYNSIYLTPTPVNQP